MIRYSTALFASFFRVTGVLVFGAGLMLHAAPPPGWTLQSLGSAQPASVSYDGAAGQTSIASPDSYINVGGSSDNSAFLYQTMTGDGEIVARVVAPFASANAGVMIRASLAANSAYFATFVADQGTFLGYGARPVTGGSGNGETGVHGASGAPIWMKLVRLGNYITVYSSADGVVWNSFCSENCTLPPTVYIGLATTSGQGALTVVDNLAVHPAGSVPADATVSVIGRPAAVGSATSGSVAGAYTLTGNGANLGGQSPDFLLLQKPIVQDGQISARIAGLSTLGGNTNAGIMIRDSLNPGAVYVSLTLSSNGLMKQSISDVGSNPASVSAPAPSVPVWLRIARHGPLFSASYSTDGIAWTPVGGTTALPMGSSVIGGPVLVAGGNDNELASMSLDNVSWTQPAALAPLDPVIAAGLASWRKPDGNGIRCADCHTPFAYDIAQFSFTRDDVRLATTPHLQQTDADAIFDMIEVLRAKYPPVGGLKDFRTFRPMQPGGGHVLGGDDASADVRDATFGFYLKDHFKIAQDRIVTLAQARAAAKELIDVNTQDIPVGLKFNLWSRSVLREGPDVGGEIAEWLPSAGVQPKPEYADYWFALQDAYLRDPSNENFWAIYHATSLWTQLDPHNFTATTHPNWRYVVVGQYLANSLFAHDELLKARGLPSQLAAEDGVEPFPAQQGVSPAVLSPFWNVGDNARVVEDEGFDGFTQRNKDSAHIDLSYNTSLKEVSGWKVDNFRLTWFWIGWMMDNSLRFSGKGSTLSGEYFIGSLWMGAVDNQTTGATDSTHGFRMHQVFFNAVQQFKLGYKPGAWTDAPTPQHFEASKGYYLGYYRWHDPDGIPDIGLPGSNALYRRLISNHIRMALLINADEARKVGGNYYGEQYTLADLPLWRDVLHWADPDWTQADEALLADLKASISPPLTVAQTGDSDGDGIPDLIDAALRPATALPNSPVVPAQISRTPEGLLAISFTRGRDDYTYVVEASTDLVNWTVVSTNPGNVGDTVTVPDPASAGLPRYFLRLRVISTKV